MPNLYVTPTEIKQALPDGFQASTTKYDLLLLQLAERVSRFIDRHCGRVFYPAVATRYFNGTGETEMWIPDLLEITNIWYSKDDGYTYTAMTSDDYYLTRGGDYNHPGSYTMLVANVNASAAISYFPAGQRSIKIEGVWAYADERGECWEDSQDTVSDDPLSSSSTSLTVNAPEGAGLWGLTPRFQAGQLLKIESEYVELVTADENPLTVVRGRNGSTGAEHAQDTAIYVWRAPGPVKEAAIIQAVRQMERGFAGFGDARANPDIGQIFYLKALDPEALAKLAPYVRDLYWE